MSIDMFEEFVGRDVVLLYKDNEKTFVLKGRLLKFSNGFLLINDVLQGETAISSDTVLRITLWRKDNDKNTSTTS